ncbi:hypothetical protein [Streptomyces sp. NBC_00203]|uniref:hypothetical protein n=1 Tax=Streptomyces sp. NBC_00203 TaxID=2975680 RepID=UPI0032431F5A
MHLRESSASRSAEREVMPSFGKIRYRWAPTVRGDREPGADLLVAQARGGRPGDFELLRGQRRPGAGRRAVRGDSGGAQLLLGAALPGRRAEPSEEVGGASQLGPCVAGPQAAPVQGAEGQPDPCVVEGPPLDARQRRRRPEQCHGVLLLGGHGPRGEDQQPQPGRDRRPPDRGDMGRGPPPYAPSAGRTRRDRGPSRARTTGAVPGAPAG